jgi:hypothetical protein
MMFLNVMKKLADFIWNRIFNRKPKSKCFYVTNIIANFCKTIKQNRTYHCLRDLYRSWPFLISRFMADAGRSARWVCKWRSRGGWRGRSSLDVFGLHIPQPPLPEEVRAVRNAPNHPRYWSATATAASCLPPRLLLPPPKHVYATPPSSDKPVTDTWNFCVHS